MKTHDEILQAVLVGEASRETPQIQEHLAGCAACREKLEKLDRLSDGLAALGAAERSDLERAREALNEVGEESAPTPGAAGPSKLRPLLVGIAAAAVLLLAFVLTRPPAEPVDPFLGHGEEIRLVVPVQGQTLEWTYELPQNGYYVLTLMDADGKVLVPRASVEENRWSPADAMVPQELPERFQVKIEAYDSSKEMKAQDHWTYP